MGYCYLVDIHILHVIPDPPESKVGATLNSPAILADAAYSRACVWLSVILMLSSAGYALTGIGSLDAIGAILISWLTFREGRDAFAKARKGIELLMRLLLHGRKTGLAWQSSVC